MATEKKEKEQKIKHIFRHTKRLRYLSERFVSDRPTAQEIYNSIKGLCDDVWSDGYIDRIKDSADFKAKREWHRKNSLEKVLTHIDDLIHEKESKPKRPRINQSKK